MNYDGILFDLDGTLWDSTEALVKIWQKVIDKTPGLTSRPTADDYMSVMGLSDTELMKRLFPELSEEKGRVLFDRCREEENDYFEKHGAKGYAGVPKMLEILAKNHKLAVVSNCGEGYIEAYMHSMETGKYICDHLCFGDTREPKSENIRRVVARNGFKNPVYVGDTAWDKKAADDAGVPFIFAAYGFGDVQGTPRIDSPMDLIELIGKDD